MVSPSPMGLDAPIRQKLPPPPQPREYPQGTLEIFAASTLTYPSLAALPVLFYLQDSNLATFTVRARRLLRNCHWPIAHHY